jgi:hypothetical protein
MWIERVGSIPYKRNFSGDLGKKSKSQRLPRRARADARRDLDDAPLRCARFPDIITSPRFATYFAAGS